MSLTFLSKLTALLELILLWGIPDARQQKPEEETIRFRDMVRIPANCRPYLIFVIYVFLFYLLLSISDSFTVVYMMRYLKLSYIATTAMQMLISLPQIFFLGIWGKISDKKGHLFALTASIWFFVGEILFLALSNKQNHLIFIPIAFLFASVANSGFIVSVSAHLCGKQKAGIKKEADKQPPFLYH